jgi:hypothetical protein
MFATLVKATLVSLFAVQGVLAEFRMDTPAELVQVGFSFPSFSGFPCGGNAWKTISNSHADLWF